MAISQINSASIADGTVVASDIAANTVTPAILTVGAPYWNSSNQVGIGTTTPGYILDAWAPTAIIGSKSTTGTNTTYYIATNTAGSTAMGIDSSVGTLTGAPYASFFWTSANYPTIFSNNSTERMRINTSGVVDIGGASGGSVGELLVVEGANSAGHRAARINNTSTTNGYSTLWMGSLNDGLLRGGSTASAFTDQLAMLTSGANPLTFYTNNTERMRIDSSGNVGIGQTNPGQKLDVSSSGDIQVRIGNSVTGAQFTYDIGRVASTGLMQFYGNQSGATGYIFSGINGERMRIDSSGNVGVGTSSPAGKLDVRNGSIYVGQSAGSTQTNRLLTGYGQVFLGNLYGEVIIRSTYDGDSNSSTLEFCTTPVVGGPSASVERMRIDSSGRVSINTTSPSTGVFLNIAGTSASQTCIGLTDTGTSYGTGSQYLAFLNSIGGLAGSIQHLTATTVGYVATSDQRLKTNIINSATALNKINQVQVRSYDWVQDKAHVEYGFIAQELYNAIPEVVSKGNDNVEISDNRGVWGIDYGRLTPILVKAIQEQQVMIEQLTTRLSALEGK